MYRYIWGNKIDPYGNITKRLGLKGRVCRVLARGKMNSILIEFIDNGQKEIVSRFSIRRI